MLMVTGGNVVVSNCDELTTFSANMKRRTQRVSVELEGEKSPGCTGDIPYRRAV